MAKGQMREVESKQMPPDSGVQSFPTFVVLGDDGQEIRRVEGRRDDPKALLRELGLRMKARQTLRRRRPRTTRRRIR